MPMHRYKTQIESPEAKCPRFALIRYRMRSRALRKLQMHTIAPKGYRKAQVGSYLSADALCHPKSSLKARARANGNGVEVGGRGERSKPWGAGIVIRKHYLRLSLVCGSIAWAGLSQLPCPLPLTERLSQICVKNSGFLLKFGPGFGLRLMGNPSYNCVFGGLQTRVLMAAFHA